jgi:hypothetical protein
MQHKIILLFPHVICDFLDRNELIVVQNEKVGAIQYQGRNGP